jgi:hypothetical protein
MNNKLQLGLRNVPLNITTGGRVARFKGSGVQAKLEKARNRNKRGVASHHKG